MCIANSVCQMTKTACWKQSLWVLPRITSTGYHGMQRDQINTNKRNTDCFEKYAECFISGVLNFKHIGKTHPTFNIMTHSVHNFFALWSCCSFFSFFYTSQRSKWLVRGSFFKYTGKNKWYFIIASKDWICNKQTQARRAYVKLAKFSSCSRDDEL